MKVGKVKLKRIQTDSENELSDEFYHVCYFCEKLIEINSSNLKSCSRLGSGRNYCPFCLRNNFHHRSSRNVLIFSFRAIIGYYHYRFYDTSPIRMWVSQIEQLIDDQVNIGLQNPTLSYDPSTLLWFADFNKIGNYKAPYDELINTVEDMYDILEIKKHLNNNVDYEMWCRFENAISLYHKQRKRPKGKRMLIPTFSTLLKYETNDVLDQTRDFTRNCLVFK